MALEEDYRTYREVIAGAIEAVRPHVEVATARLDELDEEVKRFDPHLVVCSSPVTAGSVEGIACLELSLDPLRPSAVHVGGRYSQRRNPVLDTLLTIIDEVEELENSDDARGDYQSLRTRRTEESP